MTIPRNFDQMWTLSMQEMAHRNIRDQKVKKIEKRLFHSIQRIQFVLEIDNVADQKIEANRCFQEILKPVQSLLHALIAVVK